MGIKRPIANQLLSKEAQEKVAKILDDPDYLAVLKARAVAGRLPAPLEITLWHYRFGVPALNVNIEPNVGSMTDAELAARASAIAAQAKEAAHRAATIVDKPKPQPSLDTVFTPGKVM